MKKNVNILFLFFCIFFSIVCCSKKQNTEFNISTLYGTWLIDKVIPQLLYNEEYYNKLS